MQILVATKQYKAFTQNDRAIGTVFYQKSSDSEDNSDNTSEDIVFKPYFPSEGDPWIGVLYESIETEKWRTSRELFGRYLDDPHFRIGCPTISFIIDPEIKVPEWMGENALALVEFDNTGKMVCRYGAEATGIFLVNEFEYEGEIDLGETSRFALRKIKEESKVIQTMVNTIPPFKRDEFDLDDDEDEDDDF